MIALLLSGCQAKSTTTQELTVPPAADDSVSTEPPVTDQAPVTSSNTNSLTSAIDTTSIDAVFNQNFALAKEDAATVLGTDAKFCFAKVSFLGGIVSTKGEMDYFFSSDTKVVDYYWLASFDSTQDNQKKRYLAAKRDWGNPTCTTLAEPSSFASAYETFIANGTVDASSALSSAKVNMTLTQNVWKIELFNTEGALIISETSATTPAATTSPTS